MILAILPQHRARFTHEIEAMHRLRYRVFHERLGWEVTTVSDLEMDQYDAMSPIYLLQLGDDNEVNGCARLLPSTGPTMLSRTFPVLLGETPCPNDAVIWESSRFAVNLAGASAVRRGTVAQVTIELFAGLIELGLALGWREVMTVTDLALERVGTRAGLQFTRFSPPQQIGRTMAVAGYSTVSTEMLAKVRAFGGLTGPVLHLSEHSVPLELAA